MAGPLVLVTGATGYVGGRLVPELLAAGYRVRCLVRTPAKLLDRPWCSQVEVVAGDVLDAGSLRAAMAGVDAAYYLVHSMDGEGDFRDRDRTAAATFRDAAADVGVAHLVYLGGLGRPGPRGLSDHLRSRHEVGRVLAAGPVSVTELRAAVVIGSGSASFEMLRTLVEVLPVMVTPRWVETRCQPIAVRDVLTYLVRVLDVVPEGHRVVEIGGPDVLTYREMMQVYAEVAGLRRRVIVGVPVLSPRLSSLWVGLVTPLPTGLARPLVESLVNEVVVHDDSARELVPHRPLPFREAVARALRRVQDLDVDTRWSDATSGPVPRAEDHAAPQPYDPRWAGGRVLEAAHGVRTSASPAAVHAAVCGIGGDRGYPYADGLWALRGLLDKAVGGIGTRRGRRHPDRLSVGEALDFWRVEALEPGRALRLRAEMRLPGHAWLEWRIRPDGDGAVLEQRARFLPRGLWGRLYWWGLWPFHAWIFPRTVARLAERAEHLEDVPRTPHPGARPDTDPADSASSANVTASQREAAAT